LTLMLMMVFAQFKSTMWIAAMLSNDGKPVLREPTRRAAPKRASGRPGKPRKPH
jgi:hypothetical protein